MGCGSMVCGWDKATATFPLRRRWHGVLPKDVAAGHFLPPLAHSEAPWVALEKQALTPYGGCHLGRWDSFG